MLLEEAVDGAVSPLDDPLVTRLVWRDGVVEDGDEGWLDMEEGVRLEPRVRRPLRVLVCGPAAGLSALVEAPMAAGKY